MDLDVSAQLSIVLTALLASIGTAPVRGAGLVMLVELATREQLALKG